MDLCGAALTAPNAICVYAPTSRDSVGNSTVRVTAGTVSGSLYKQNAVGYNNYAAEILLSGGTFSVDPTAYAVSGYAAAENAGVYTVSESTPD